jgi:hypothetical protein
MSFHDGHNRAHQLFGKTDGSAVGRHDRPGSVGCVRPLSATHDVHPAKQCSGSDAAPEAVTQVHRSLDDVVSEVMRHRVESPEHGDAHRHAIRPDGEDRRLATI